MKKSVEIIGVVLVWTSIISFAAYLFCAFSHIDGREIFAVVSVVAFMVGFWLTVVHDMPTHSSNDKRN